MGTKPWDTFQPDLNSANVARTSGTAWTVCQVSQACGWGMGGRALWWARGAPGEGQSMFAVHGTLGARPGRCGRSVTLALHGEERGSALRSVGEVFRRRQEGESMAFIWPHLLSWPFRRVYLRVACLQGPLGIPALLTSNPKLSLLTPFYYYNFSLYQEKKTTSYVFLDIDLPPSLINRNICSPLGMFYLCILHVASPLADGWGIACVLPPFIRTYFAMLLREQRVGFCVFFSPPQRERGMWLPTANLKKFEY